MPPDSTMRALLGSPDSTHPKSALINAGLDRVLPQPANKGTMLGPTGVGWYDKLLNRLESWRVGPGAEVQNAAEQFTGPMHAPETAPGRYAETIASFVPGALTGGAEITGPAALLGA
jgi:hypothetical protein